MASPSSVLTLGLGNWGSASLLVTLGFGSGEAGVVGEPGLHAWECISPPLLMRSDANKLNYEQITPLMFWSQDE